MKIVLFMSQKQAKGKKKEGMRGEDSGKLGDNDFGDGWSVRMRNAMYGYQ